MPLSDTMFRQHLPQVSDTDPQIQIFSTIDDNISHCF